MFLARKILFREKQFIPTPIAPESSNQPQVKRLPTAANDNQQKLDQNLKAVNENADLNSSAHSSDSLSDDSPRNILKNITINPEGQIEVQTESQELRAESTPNSGISTLQKTLNPDAKLIHCLTMTFCKSFKFSQSQLFDITSKIYSLKLDAKAVRLEFTKCHNLDDIDLENIGAAIGSCFSDLEYISVKITRCHRVTILGVQRLIERLSVNQTSVKCLRLRFRNCRNLFSESARTLIIVIRNWLLNLKELTIIFANNVSAISETINTWKKDVSYRAIFEGLGDGLKKFDVIYCRSSFKLDNSMDYYLNYVNEKMLSEDVQEGLLVHGSIVVYFQKPVWSSVKEKALSFSK